MDQQQQQQQQQQHDGDPAGGRRMQSQRSLPLSAQPESATITATDNSHSDDDNNRIYERRFEAVVPATSTTTTTSDGEQQSSDQHDQQQNPRNRQRFNNYCTPADDDGESSSAAAPTDEEHSFAMNPQTVESSVTSTPTDEEEDPRVLLHKPPYYNNNTASSNERSAAAAATRRQPSTPTRMETPPRHQNQQQHQQQQQQSANQESGGRLWRLAGEIAAGKAPSPLLGQTPNDAKANLGQLKESFMERMRSRADPDALVAPPTPPRPDPRAAQVLVKMADSLSDDHHYREEEAFLMNTGLAHKRVRVVQLLIIGLVGLLLGWLGNFFVSSSCYFASVPVQVGQNGDVFALHFGLWNYSPVDSALNGFKYCYPYGGQHTGDAPVVSRAVNLAALLAGTYSLVVLWWYLISGRANAAFWKAAVYSAVAAGVLQFATPIFFFAGTMCRTSSCSAGPASALSAVTAVAWAVLGAELYYHCPVAGMLDPPQCSPPMDGSANNGSAASTPSTPVAQLEMADLAEASQEYLDRFQMKRRRGHYRPPEFA